MTGQTNNFMLWYMSNPKQTMLESIQEAAAQYKKTRNRPAELCLMNPKDFDVVMQDKEHLPDERELRIRPWLAVLPHHILIGIDDEPHYARTPRELVHTNEETA